MWIKILLLFFVFSFLFKTDTSFDQDLGRHIKLGEIITQTWQVPKVNLFSYTNPDFPFINTHWLFGVIAYLFNQAGILSLLLVVKLIIFLFSVWLTIKIIPKEKTALLLPIGFILLHVLRERTELRPEIFSFLFTASTYYILEKFSKYRSSDRSTNIPKSIFFLPLIQLIWINTHIYFFVGLILQAIFFIHLIYQQLRSHILSGKLKLLAVIFILSVIVSLLNPNGLAGLFYPLNVTKNYGYTIVENQTMFLLESINFRDPNFLFVKLSVAITAISILLALIKRGSEVKNILISVFGMVLALINVRSFPYLVFLSFPAVLLNLPQFKFRGLIKSLTWIFIPLLFVESYLYLNGDYYRFNDKYINPGLEFQQSVKGAMDFVLEKNLPQPIFNNFDIGSYIIYRAYPKYKVFVDGRPEAYPADFFQQIYIPIQGDYAKFKEAEKVYGFKIVIFSHTDQTPWGRNFLQNIVKDPDWKLVYIDDFMVVLTRSEIIREKGLKIIDLASLTPVSYNLSGAKISSYAYLRMGIFLLNTGNQASANQFLEKAQRLFPDSPILTGKKNNFFW